MQKEPNTVGWYDNAVSLACRDWPFRSLLLWWAGITEHLMLTVPNGKLPHKPASTETNQNWESKCYIFYIQWARTLMDLWGMRFAGGWLGSGPRFQISLSGDKCSASNFVSSVPFPVCEMMGYYWCVWSVGKCHSWLVCAAHKGVFGKLNLMFLHPRVQINQVSNNQLTNIKNHFQENSN